MSDLPKLILVQVKICVNVLKEAYVSKTCPRQSCITLLWRSL